MLAALNKIDNLLWFCDKCLPDIAAAFAPKQTPKQNQHAGTTQLSDNSQQQQMQNQTQGKTLADLVQQPAIASTSSTDTQFAVPLQQQNQAETAQPTGDSQQQQKLNDIQNKTLVDLVQQPLATAANPNIIDNSIQMELGENNIDSSESTVETAAKRRRSTGESDHYDALNLPPPGSVSTKVTSTNYRCIHLTPFDPSTDESKVIEYINSKNRDPTEVMGCKKLVPAKLKNNKLSFVSFKLTVHKEYFDIYADKYFWPNGVLANEFVARSPKSQQQPNSNKIRVNPFALSKPRRKNHVSHNHAQNSPTHIANTAQSANRNRSNPYQNWFGPNRFTNNHGSAQFSHSNHRNGKFNGKQKNHRTPFHQIMQRPNQNQPMYDMSQPAQLNTGFMVEEPLRLINQMMGQLRNLLNRY